MTYYGYNPPFFGGHQNILSRQSGDRLIKNDLIQLILTSTGERVMRPTFGTFLKRSIMELGDPDFLVSLRENVQAAIDNYDTRVICAVNLNFDEEKKQINVKITGVFSDQPGVPINFDINIPVPVIGR